MNEPVTIREMLGVEESSGKVRRPWKVAVVGLSDNSLKPSFYVSKYMQERGYTILPVNPQLESVLGEPCVASLGELKETPDVVNVFRLPRFVPAIVEEMIQLGWKRLWVQSGIVHPEAAMRAEAAGISVVMDRCIMVERMRLR